MANTEIKVNLADLDDRQLIIVNDKKPASPDKSLSAKGGVKFTVTKKAFLKLEKSFPGRYEVLDVYKSQQQLRSVSNVQPTAKIRPEVKHVDESGLGDVSRAYNAADAIQVIKGLDTKEAVDKFIEGDERRSVIQAAEKQVETFTPEKAGEIKDGDEK